MKYIVDIKGEIEGDYEIIGKYEERRCRMTNAEKYKEVFGMDPETKNCPTHVCLECPCCKKVEGKYICSLDTRVWWQDDYKEVKTNENND